MTPSFFGRATELALLQSELERATASGSGRLVALRGRRQVGKSRLVEHFAEQSRVPYGVVAGMKGTPVEVQMRRAVETLHSSAVALPTLDSVDAVLPANWFDLLSRLRLAVGRGPSILVIDEFPWAEETNSGLDGLFQSLWDHHLKKLPVLVILVGSDDAMMQRLFERDRPLFGRLSTNLVVEPFNPSETAQALGDARSGVQVLDIQLVTGGFPELVAHARQFDSVETLVDDALSRPHTLLADVAEINLAAEMTDGTNARLVLEAIGADEVGVVNFSRIASLLGGGKAAETAVSRSVDTLVGTKRIVAIDLPADGRGGRLKRYRIADPYLRFWFRFVEPQLRSIEVGRSDLARAAFRRSWPSWRGKAIEPIARQSLLRLAPRLPPPFDTVESVEAWWDRRGVHEYDLVGADRHGSLVVAGSIKWREHAPFDAHDLAELATARSVVPRAAAASLLAIAPRGVVPGLPVDLALDADQLLAAWGGWPGHPRLARGSRVP